MEEEKLWKHVLKNAFNMDGCVGQFTAKNTGYEYIFLLKEANDSGKLCVKDYPIFSCKETNVNAWLQDWKNEEVDASMLENLKEALNIYCGQKEVSMSAEEFINKVAYMNVNKRGGTVQTVGFDTTAVINYAKRYREFILKEISILAGENKEATVFVAGKRDSYFLRLMETLGIQNNEVEIDDKKVKFINITHSFKHGITGKKLAIEMQQR